MTLEILDLCWLFSKLRNRYPIGRFPTPDHMLLLPSIFELPEEEEGSGPLLCHNVGVSSAVLENYAGLRLHEMRGPETTCRSGRYQWCYRDLRICHVCFTMPQRMELIVTNKSALKSAEICKSSVGHNQHHRIYT